MKHTFPLAAILCGATLFTGCAYRDTDDLDEDAYPVRRVRVSTVTPGYYYGDFDEDTPYYSYGGRRYYRTSNRYVYYANRRPYYVTALPSRSVYITPPRHRTRVIESPDNRHSPDWPR